MYTQILMKKMHFKRPLKRQNGVLKHTRTHTTVTSIPRQRRSTKMFAYVFYLYISSFDRVCEVLRKSKEWRGNARGARFYSGSEGTSSVAVVTFEKINISTARDITRGRGNDRKTHESDRGATRWSFRVLFYALYDCSRRS